MKFEDPTHSRDRVEGGDQSVPSTSTSSTSRSELDLESALHFLHPVVRPLASYLLNCNASSPQSAPTRSTMSSKFNPIHGKKVVIIGGSSGLGTLVHPLPFVAP